jgi:hypothetical protein
MPVVFSPGEAETRPLNPEEIVYTTAQKVADLLGIGPQEAVLMSASAEANAVFVTGADYRNIGFSVSDILLIYSDADPLGQEVTVTAITSTTSGVKLTFTVNEDGVSSINPGLYETTDNGYVQNTASFTNGKTRGVKKSHVEQRIKEIQDRIDNITHNAWRPTLVSAEYINFDTYKPYRRRYYTDYVGTTPLLYRNVQQILRLELWQGDDYREIGAAEARIKFDDVSDLASAAIYISPGNGHVATLAQGTGTGQWRDDFDATTVAQNFADLVNKEDRVSKATVEFSPAFTLEGSTSNIAVNNEFLATANSDYGTGVVKLTSMRAVKAGEVCSIVTTNSNIEISQTQTNTATVTSVVSTTVNVNSTTGFVNAGVCVKGDTVFRYLRKTATSFLDCVVVTGSALGDITGTITQESLLVDLQGGSSSGDNARLRDWWLDPEMGIIYFNNSYPFFEWNAVKVSYIYGERYLEKAIEEAATKFVAVDLLMADDRSVLIPEGSQNVPLAQKIQMFKEEANSLLNRYKEIVLFE